MFVPSVELVEGAAGGFVIGVFCPAVCRKIKASFVKLFTKGESALEARVKALEAKIVKDGQTAIADAEAEAKKAVVAAEAEIKKA